jgi:hypothetical protein
MRRAEMADANSPRCFCSSGARARPRRVSAELSGSLPPARPVRPDLFEARPDSRPGRACRQAGHVLHLREAHRGRRRSESGGRCTAAILAFRALVTSARLTASRRGCPELAPDVSKSFPEALPRPNGSSIRGPVGPLTRAGSPLDFGLGGGIRVAAHPRTSHPSHLSHLSRSTPAPELTNPSTISPTSSS